MNENQPLRVRQLAVAGALTGAVGVLYALSTDPGLTRSVTIVAVAILIGVAIELTLAAREKF